MKKTNYLGDPNASVYKQTDIFTTRKCPMCHQRYKRYTNEMEYISDFDKKIFCSYNCRSKYYKEHAKERAKWRQNQDLALRHDKLKKQQQIYDAKKYSESKGA